VRLFDDLVRTDLRPKAESEPRFHYLNTSARPAVGAYRSIAEKWFHRLPDPPKAELRGRFRSPIDWQHDSAFFELYVHELFCQIGFALQIHPKAKNCHLPDFLVCAGRAPQFYVEATLAGVPSTKEQGANAREAIVYDSLNKIDSPNFFLDIDVSGAPKRSPPTRKLRTQIENWLAGLDPDKIGEFFQTGRYDAVPTLTWKHSGWQITIRPIPKSPRARGRPGIRPIGMLSPEGGWLKTRSELKLAFENKASRYGDLELPFMIAVNYVGLHSDNTDIMDSLFGQETVVFRQKSDGTISAGRQSRTPNGFWIGPNGPRNPQVSAVMVATDLCPWSVGVCTPEVFHNPWATHALPKDKIPVPQHSINLRTECLEHTGGRSAGEILAIPSPWPISDDFADD